MKGEVRGKYHRSPPASASRTSASGGAGGRRGDEDVGYDCNFSLMDVSTPGTLYPEIIGLQRQPSSLGANSGGDATGGWLNGDDEGVGGGGGGTLLLEGELPAFNDGASVVEFSYTSFDHQSPNELSMARRWSVVSAP